MARGRHGRTPSADSRDGDAAYSEDEYYSYYDEEEEDESPSPSPERRRRRDGHRERRADRGRARTRDHGGRRGGHRSRGGGGGGRRGHRSEGHRGDRHRAHKDRRSRSRRRDRHGGGRDCDRGRDGDRGRDRGGRDNGDVKVVGGSGDWRRDMRDFIEKNGLDERTREALKQLDKPKAIEVMGIDGGRNTFILENVRNPDAVVMSRIKRVTSA